MFLKTEGVKTNQMKCILAKKGNDKILTKFLVSRISDEIFLHHSLCRHISPYPYISTFVDYDYTFPRIVITHRQCKRNLWGLDEVSGREAGFLTRHQRTSTVCKRKTYTLCN